MQNKELIQHFYSSFSDGNAEEMISCYDANISFSDPVFTSLKGEEACNLWRMLVHSSKGQLKISFSNILADNKTGSADWTAEYIFSKTGRTVINKIHAEFEFQNGKIIRHRDHFNLWQWSRQALGWKGLFFGWTPFMKAGIRKFARRNLLKFIDSK